MTKPDNKTQNFGVQLTSKIDKVKVYAAGATVTRVATLECADGNLPEQVEITGLPLALDDSSVRVRVEGSTAIATDVRIGLAVPPRQETPTPPLEEELRQATAEVQRIEDIISLIDNEIEVLRQLHVPVRPTGEDGKAPPPSPLEARLAIANFKDEQIRARIQERRDTQENLRKAQEQLENLNHKQALASSAREVKPHELRKTVIVGLSDEGEGTIAEQRLVVEYFVPGARWTPSYVCRLDSANHTAAIAVRAFLCQRTGEDWSGVRLELSTAEPMSWCELPELPSLRLGRAQPVLRKSGWRLPPVGAQTLFEDYDRQKREMLATLPKYNLSIDLSAREVSPLPYRAITTQDEYTANQFSEEINLDRDRFVAVPPKSQPDSSIDPEPILEQAIIDMQEDLVQLRQAVARAIATRKRTEQQYNTNQSQANNWEQRAQLALQKGDETLAREVQTRKEYYFEAAATLKTQLDQQTAQVDILKRQLSTLESQICEAKTKKDMLKARLSFAKTNEQLQSTLEQLKTSSAMEAFERMEEKVLELEARFQGVAKPKSNDIENELSMPEFVKGVAEVVDPVEEQQSSREMDTSWLLQDDDIANLFDSTSPSIHKSGIDKNTPVLAYGLMQIGTPDERSKRGKLSIERQQEVYLEILKRQQVTVTFDVLKIVKQAVSNSQNCRYVNLPSGGINVRQVAGSFDYAYRADGRVDVPSDGQFHSVALTSQSTDVDVRYVVVPREDTNVFRIAQLKNPLQAPLLAGAADVYVDGEYILSTTIATVPPKGQMELGLGVEQAIKVARNTTYQEVRSSESLVAFNELRHRIQIDIANRLPREARIEVRERIPVPQDGAKVEVEMGKVSPEWEKYEQEERETPIRGGYRWRVNVPGGQQAKLSAQYKIKTFVDNELIDGNRRE